MTQRYAVSLQCKITSTFYSPQEKKPKNKRMKCYLSFPKLQTHMAFQRSTDTLIHYAVFDQLWIQLCNYDITTMWIQLYNIKYIFDKFN